MATILQPFLFKWDAVDSASDIDRFTLAIHNMPDDKIIAELIRIRGNGRNEFPIRPMWNAMIAGIVFQHPTAAALLRELRRNGQLRDACGLHPLLGVAAVPDQTNMSRFLTNVIALEPMIREMFDSLVGSATTRLASLGQRLAFDGKAISTFSTGCKDRETGKTSDPDADRGTKTYRGVHPDGKPWQKIVHGFGYPLHLIVDSVHEIPVAYEVMKASASETTRLLPLVNQLAQTRPQLIERTEELAADRGLDSAENNRVLLQEHDIRPIIDNRLLWRQEKNEPGYDPAKPITRPLYPDRADSILYAEKGNILCACPATGEIRDMALWGFEKDPESLKYRCPAAAYGFACAGAAQCLAMSGGSFGDFGRHDPQPVTNPRQGSAPNRNATQGDIQPHPPP